MPDQLSQEHIVASLTTWWHDRFTLPVATVWPGMVLDTATAGEWVEVFVQRWTRPPQRAGAPERMTLSLVVQCFVTPSPDTGRVHELSDAAYDVFSGQTVPVHNFEESGAPLVGYVVLAEPDVRDLSRNQLISLQQGVQHLALTWSGIAEPV